MTDDSSLTRSKRPWRVTLFSLAVLALGGGINLSRAAWAWRTDLPVSTSMPMAWLAVTSLAWGVVLSACSVGLWRLRPWGRRGMLAAVSLYQVHIWINHLLFDRSDYAPQVWPLAVVHTLLTLLVVWGFLYWPAVRRLYGEEKG